MLSHTKCDALMIGRGSLINPFIFHQIRSHFAKRNYHPSQENFYQYMQVYLQNIPDKMSKKTKINKMKELMNSLFQGNAQLISKRQTVLTYAPTDLESYMKFALPIFYECIAL